MSYILIVDDDTTMAQALSDMVGLFDWETQIVHGPRPALNAIQAKQPALILLDLNMPELDGFEFLEEFVNLPEAKRMNKVIVILTSSDYEKDRERAKQYNVVSGYVTKPLTHEKLVSIMETCFRER